MMKLIHSLQNISGSLISRFLFSLDCKALPSKKLTFYRLVLWGIVFFASSVLYAQKKTEWTVVYEHKGVLVETKIKANGLVETRGKAHLPISMELARKKLLQAFEKCQPKMKGCLKMNIEKQKNHYVIYQLFGLPWPLRNRDLVLIGKESTQKKLYRLSLTSASKLKPEKYFTVRIKRAYGHWEIRKKGRHSSVIENRMYIEPGGYLNTGIANDRLRDVAIRTMIGVVKSIE